MYKSNNPRGKRASEWLSGLRSATRPGVCGFEFRPADGCLSVLRLIKVSLANARKEIIIQFLHKPATL